MGSDDNNNTDCYRVECSYLKKCEGANETWKEDIRLIGKIYVI